MTGLPPDPFSTVYQAPEYYGAPSDGFTQFAAQHLERGARVLDLGAGQGRNARWLAGQGHFSVASDISISALHQLATSGGDPGTVPLCVVSDARKPPFREKVFDCIVILTTLNHLQAESQSSTAKLTRALLAPRGLVYVVAFTTDDPAHSGRGVATECAELIAHFFAPGELRSLFSSVGFETIHYSEYTKLDTSHGAPHLHGKAKFIGRKPI